MKTLLFFLGVIIVMSNLSMGTADYGNDGSFCADLYPQRYLDEEQFTGAWFGTEVIQHRGSYDESTVDGDNLTDSCLRMDIYEITHEETTTDPPFYDSYDYVYNGERITPDPLDQYNYVNLFWQESGHYYEFPLRYTKTRPGFWMTSPPVSDAERNSTHTQLAVQVMKAVDNQLTLTFCRTVPPIELYSVILSRIPNSLSHEEIESVRNLLRRRGLGLSSIRKVCTSDTSGSQRSQLTFFSMMLLSLRFFFHY